MLVGARRGSPPCVAPAAAAAPNHMPQDEVPNRALCPDKDVFVHSSMIVTCIALPREHGGTGLGVGRRARHTR